MPLADPPLYVGAAAVYPYSDVLLAELKRVSRYDEEFSLGKVVGEHVWVPRGIAPRGPDLRSVGIPVGFDLQFKPRNEEQLRVFEDSADRLFKGHSFIIQAPTGWGKTYLGCALIGAVGRKSLVITTKSDIVDQWISSLKVVLNLKDEEIGIWRADSEPQDHHKVVVALVQSAMKGPERYPNVKYGDFGVVLCDEVHRMGAEQFSQAMWWFPGKLRIGLSATPYRKDGRDEIFEAHIGPVQVIAKMETLVPNVVVKNTGWKVPMRYDYEKGWIQIPHSPGKTMHMSKLMGRDPRRNQIIVNFLCAAHKKGRSTIVFADMMEHLKNIHHGLLGAGIPSADIAYYVGTDAGVYSGSQADRKRQREKAKIKPILLATYRMASEATDIPWLDACVLATPRSDVNQIVGRIRREYPDKKTPVVFDLVDQQSKIFTMYANKRIEWYRSIGCRVQFLN